MGINSQGVAYNFGQLGSVYTTHSQDAIKPPTGKVFVAITMLEDTTFDSVGGLVAERVVVPGATTADPNTLTGDIFISTEQPAHDLADGSETTTEGSGGLVVDGVAFPEGITIYGRWTEIDISGSSTGAIIAYIGE
tara:strand:- start:63 stop:470 length:408 start_codon:yes stop_codon:yes gene_type:complete